MAPVQEGDFTFVTNNAKDFRCLYAQQEIHADLVILIPNVPPAEQRELFDAALDELAEAPGLINEALEVGLVEGVIEISRYELSGPSRAVLLRRQWKFRVFWTSEGTRESNADGPRWNSSPRPWGRGKGASRPPTLASSADRSISW